MRSSVEYLIVGAGPCGLGAAWRLNQLGTNDFLVVDGALQPGGLASSFVDDQGFTWDIGGHIQFSHYENFDEVMDLALPDGWLYHQRESWVWIHQRWVPYPFQNNLWRLDPSFQVECIKGLEALQNRTPSSPQHFLEWINASFGEGLARIFMRPYNLKVWAHPLESMDYQWIGERVATVDLEKVKANIASRKDEVSWGPNATFRFPKFGGTGAIWQSVAKKIGLDKVRLNTRVVKIDAQARRASFADGNEIEYRHLLSTIPLNQLTTMAGVSLKAPMRSSQSHIVGIGLKGQASESLRTKCWMYFPEDNCPFYRVTVFSNYSPNNVPDSKSHWSLMCETSASEFKPVDSSRVVADTIQGLKNTGLIQEESAIVSRWHYRATPGYPTPFLGRDEIVHSALEELKKNEIYSRGRFGLWKYEVSNQDHSFMQGFEWADKMINGRAEETAFHPNRVNAPGKRPKVA